MLELLPDVFDRPPPPPITWAPKNKRREGEKNLHLLTNKQTDKQTNKQTNPK